MCSQYTVSSRKEELEALGLRGSDISGRFFPTHEAPIINKEREVQNMVFGLIPSWSKEFKVKFATHNARIETVTDKPTWKKPFESRHIVVPMTGFFEAAYSGPLAGNMIQFKSPLIFAAGIFDNWNEKQSFSILTREPSKFIEEFGHDRTPIFIKPEFINSWLSMTDKDSEFIRESLLNNAYHPELEVEIDRPLKKGWEKRK